MLRHSTVTKRHNSVTNELWRRARRDSRTCRARRRPVGSMTSTGRSAGWASRTASAGAPAGPSTWRRSPQAAVDVAADVVRVVGLHLRRPAYRARQHQVAEPRREPLDLPLDRAGHVHVAPVRHVAVGPERVLSRGRARRVDEALLGHQHVGPRRAAAAGHHPLGRRHLLERPAEVHRGRARGTPRPATAPARPARSRS